MINIFFVYAITIKDFKLIDIAIENNIPPAYIESNEYYSVYKLILDNGDRTLLEYSLKKNIAFIDHYIEFPLWNEIHYAMKKSILWSLPVFEKYMRINDSYLTVRVEGGGGYHTNPLMMSIYSGNPKTVEYYLNKGIDPNSLYIPFRFGEFRYLTALDLCYEIKLSKTGYSNTDYSLINSIIDIVKVSGGRTVVEILNDKKSYAYFLNFGKIIRTAIIIDTDARLMEKPNTDSKIIDSFKLDEKIIMLEVFADPTLPKNDFIYWYKIIRKNEQIGWVFSQYVKEEY